MISPESENLLEKMRVASPCSVSWDGMKGDDKKRFCNHCNLHVYNISAMTRSEAENLIRTTEGRLCARFYRRADGTVLTQDCPVGLKALRRRLKMRVGVFLSALFGLTLNVFGQDAKSEVKSNEPKFQITRIIDSANPQNSLATIKGTVFDITNAVVVGAEVTLTNERTKQSVNLKTDSEGKFSFRQIEAGNYTLQVIAVGFRTFKIDKVEIKKEELLDVSCTIEVGATVGELVIIEAISTEGKPAEESLPQKTIIDLPLQPNKSTTKQESTENGKAKGDDIIKITRHVNPANNQNKGSIVEGIIFDLAETGVPDAKVVLVNEKTNEEVIVKTNDKGKFIFQNIKADTYLLKVKADGFKAVEMVDFKVAENETISISLTLEILHRDSGCLLPDEPKKPL